jgi:ribosome-associated toxin RatA of RatAB toxin-antitoxin module
LSQIERSIVLPFTREQLFSLVSDIPRYPEFVPYCLDAKILNENQGVVEGSLRAGYKGLGYNFATQNTNQAPEQIKMKLLSGPFQRLEGDWFFDETAHGTQIRLKLTIVFKNPILGMMFKHKIDELTDLVMKAFIDRARVLY